MKELEFYFCPIEITSILFGNEILKNNSFDLIYKYNCKYLNF